jgi:hypothetical protein
MALQLKVNELIAAQKGAHNSLIAIESFPRRNGEPSTIGPFGWPPSRRAVPAPTSIAAVEDVKATVEEPAPRAQVIATTLGTA